MFVAVICCDCLCAFQYQYVCSQHVISHCLIFFPSLLPAGIKDTTVAIAADSSKEVGAGQLKASADTETGTKQRRVNKQLTSYDNKAGDDVEHKKNS